MNKRRGRILGMETIDGKQVISAETPLIEMLKYAIDDIRLFFNNDVRFLKQF